MRLQALNFAILAFTIVSFTQVISYGETLDWPQWRGPAGNGHSSASDVPVRWSADSVVWQTKLPGLGQSTPIYWENKLFLTSSLDDGKKRALVCVDLKTGKILWQKTCWEGSAEQTHSMNNRASSTCVTDGKRIISFFGHGGIHCHGNAMAMAWQCHGKAMAVPWDCHANAMAWPWQCHGHAMALPWQCHGNST